jgi:2-C-methyl-D-erythritol 4-phosphate cytidylyltransferase/2-C-methyl-D-erythritol 2,4-cyclodiphosphate synthase
MRVSAIVVAAGSGERAGGGVPKQFRRLGAELVLRRSLRLFASHPKVNAVQTVIDLRYDEHFRLAGDGLPKLLPPVAGAATRQGSVRAGLKALEQDGPDTVLIHDAARPLASSALVGRAIDAASATGAAVPVLPLPDTIKRIAATGRVVDTLARETLRAVQTPQAFAFAPILAAHRKAADVGRDDFPDDAALAEWAGMEVATFPGEAANMKLTTEDDFARAIAAEAGMLSDIRTGSGFDVHAFGPGDHVTLGGVRIAHTHALTGHSDADVLLHAITDAILGAVAAGDIGQHFPPSDPRLRGASSERFLAHAVSLVATHGGRIAHLDGTVLCETPMIAPHAAAMRANIAKIAEIEPNRVSIKATTTERLGFLGRGEGIAAMATATVRLPWSG